MATFNIYGYNDGEDSEPLYTITLNQDNTEVLAVSSADPEDKEDAEYNLKSYMDKGLTAVDALFRLAGSYGMVKSAGADGARVI